MEALVPMFAFCLLLLGFGFSLVFIFYAVENYPDKYTTEVNLTLRSVAMLLYTVFATAVFVYASVKIFEPNAQIINLGYLLRPCLMFGGLATGLYWLKLHEKVEQEGGDQR